MADFSQRSGFPLILSRHIRIRVHSPSRCARPGALALASPTTTRPQGECAAELPTDGMAAVSFGLHRDPRPALRINTRAGRGADVSSKQIMWRLGL